MYTQAQLAHRLTRITQKVEARRNAANREVKALAFEAFDSASADAIAQHQDAITRYQNEIAKTQWGDSKTRTTMSQVELEELLSALACCGSFGPVEKAAIALASQLTDSDDPVEHRLQALARFSHTFPDKFKGTISELEAKLCLGLEVHASLRNCTTVHDLAPEKFSVEINEGYMTVQGCLAFTLGIGNDVEVPALSVLKDLLSVTIRGSLFDASSSQVERAPVRELLTLRHTIC